MVRFQLFPRSVELPQELTPVLLAFQQATDQIGSLTQNLSSDQVLAVLRPALEAADYTVESGKHAAGKIQVPVLFGIDNHIDKSFYADAVSADGRIVIEVEAGRAVVNYQFLKDIFQASMMHSAEYLILAVRNKYRGQNDFVTIYAFLETLYISGRLKLPLRGILLIGY